MECGWHPGELEVQRRAGVKEPGRLRQGVHDALPPHFREFLAVQRFIVAATAGDGGSLVSSLVVGWPGFTSTVDPQTVCIDKKGFGDPEILTRLSANPQVGLLAFDPSTRRRIRINGFASIGADAVTIRVKETFGNCRQYVQRRPASGPTPQKMQIVADKPALNGRQHSWVASADTCFIASTHATAGLDVSHRGGRPGFVAVIAEDVLEFADYAGNDMFQTLGNLTANSTAAMLFVDFDSGSTLQLQGHAKVTWDREGSPTGRCVTFRIDRMVEKCVKEPWRWPVLEYSPVNP